VRVFSLLVWRRESSNRIRWGWWRVLYILAIWHGSRHVWRSRVFRLDRRPAILARFFLFCLSTWKETWRVAYT
jgi:hypothetical protein